MMPLDTNPMTMGLRTGPEQAEGMPVLIQVPRVDEPHEHVAVWRPEAPVRFRFRPSSPASSRPGPSVSFRAASRPRRRLRRGVRRAGESLLVLAAMAGTFTIGWTTRGGGELYPPVLSTAATGQNASRCSLLSGSGARSLQTPPPVTVAIAIADTGTGADADAHSIATTPAPVADAEMPVVFPGYLLPDNTREESAHEGG
jgi:hypothetical protein